ncbi:DNA mismatch repair endonuclease MutL [Gynurincola endophyticus]|uniref:DNA mismatch repair endonuclease MutL n=1 Tax=Gynurincola endophyticus TaxID=2479004 RepID=UPI000F8E63B8|nr:DNA mismatch repair endonuclease MutL [Gynurincola endophyticus]
MSNTIHLLPDNIANQIAAGEVIQRPSSAVKELLENAVDAGATEIKLIIQDAGKALIQVIDNGKGMSEADARLCFERHATSKIQQIEDLFNIKTMGFRGEALASIAAVAQVELKSKTAGAEHGVLIEVENSKIIHEEPVAMNTGTSIAMKNLFFNIPARRNFLKSNSAEMRHIVDEFIRVALSFPNIFFSLTNNGQEMFHLETGTLKQRIIQLLGNQYNAKVVTVQEKTDYMNIYGFVGKPATAKKTRGDQYFFVNNRFIKSGYLNHAVMNAFQELLPADSFPMYVLFIDLDPSEVDINVHPTKQEIKFTDEKIVYAFVQAAIKHALAQFSVTPTLEFDLDPNIQQLDAVAKPFTEEQQSAASASSLAQNFSQKHQAHFIQPRSDKPEKNWQSFFTGAGSHTGSGKSSNFPDFPATSSDNPTGEKFESLLDQLKKNTTDTFEYEQPATFSYARTGLALELNESNPCIQIQGGHILASTNRGFIVVHQHYAHERVLYERFQSSSVERPIPVQQSLFPLTLHLSVQDAVLLEELISELLPLGYKIEPFGQQTFLIQGSPADVEEGNAKLIIEQVIEQFKHSTTEYKLSNREKLLRTLAKQQAIKTGSYLSDVEMKQLVQDLLNCNQPNVTSGGNPTYIEFKTDYIAQMFKTAR